METTSNKKIFTFGKNNYKVNSSGQWQYSIVEQSTIENSNNSSWKWTKKSRVPDKVLKMVETYNEITIN